MINRFVLHDWSVIRSDFKCPISVFWQQLLAWQKKRKKRNHRLKGIDLTATAAETESVDVTATGHVVFGTGIRRLDISSRAGARRLRNVSLPSRCCGIVTIWNDLKYENIIQPVFIWLTIDIQLAVIGEKSFEVEPSVFSLWAIHLEIHHPVGFSPPEETHNLSEDHSTQWDDQIIRRSISQVSLHSQIVYMLIYTHLYLFNGWYSGLPGMLVVQAKGVPKAGLSM